MPAQDLVELLKEAGTKYHLDAEFHAIVEHSVEVVLFFKNNFAQELDSERTEILKESARLGASLALVIKEKDIINGINETSARGDRQAGQRQDPMGRRRER